MRAELEVWGVKVQHRQGLFPPLLATEAAPLILELLGESGTSGTGRV